MFGLEAADDKTKKKLLYVGGGFFAVLNLFLTFTRDSKTQTVPQTIKAPPQQADESTATPVLLSPSSSAPSVNPSMHWLERHFCRGYQTSKRCSHRALHPRSRELRMRGEKIDGAPEKNVLAHQLTTSPVETLANNGKIVIK